MNTLEQQRIIRRQRKRKRQEREKIWVKKRVGLKEKNIRGKRI